MMDDPKPIKDDEPERWIEETPEGYIVFKRTPRKKTIVSPESKVDLVEGYHAATIFLVTIWRRDKGKSIFSERDFDEFSQFCSYLTGDPASIGDWRRCYLEMKGQKISKDQRAPTSVDTDIISYPEAFHILQILTTWHYRDFGFEFPQLIALLDSMVNDPQSHTAEWELWSQAIQRAKAGEMMGYD